MPAPRERLGEPHRAARRRRRRGRSDLHRDPGEDGQVEHVGDLRRAQRPARLLDEHDPGGARERRRAYARAAARGSSRGGRRPRRRRPRRPRASRARRRVRSRRWSRPGRRAARPRARRRPPRPATGARVRSDPPRGSSATPGAASTASRSSASVGASGPRVQPVDAARPAGRRRGRRSRAGRRRGRRGGPRRASRASTSEQAAASTDVPEPPLGDHSANSTCAPPPSGARRRVHGSGGSGEGVKHRRPPRMPEQGSIHEIHHECHARCSVADRVGEEPGRRTGPPEAGPQQSSSVRATRRGPSWPRRHRSPPGPGESAASSWLPFRLVRQSLNRPAERT